MSSVSQFPTSSTSDRIQKVAVLRAPRSRVWRALTEPSQFGEWFGCKLDGRFIPGQTIGGPVTAPGYTHLRLEIVVEQIEPERLFSWRWQPGGDPDIDPAEPMTLVVFELEEISEGTRLTVTETGFDRIPVTRRGRAYRENDEGWTGQMKSIERYLASH